MSYCTQSDIEDRIGTEDLVALTDHSGTGTVDTEVVQSAIDGACSLIDSYLGVRYAVPLPVGGDPPEVLRTRAVNLAVYLLRLGRDSVTEDVRAQHEEDLEWLREVAAGKASPGLEPDAAPLRDDPNVRHATRPRLFGRGEPL